MNPSTSDQLIDIDQLNASCDGDDALMRELLKMYFEQADQIMAGLTAAVAARNPREIDHLSHKLAGSSLACGLNAIVTPLRRMEGNAKAGSVEGAEEFVREAGAALELLRKAVRDFIGGNPAP